MPPMIVMGVMAATMIAGTVLSAAAAKRQGQVGADTATANAQLRANELQAQATQAYRQAQLIERDAQAFDIDAIEARQASDFAAARQYEQARAFKSEQRVQVAGAGLEAVGSPLLVMAETARQLELDNLVIRHQGDVEVSQAQDQARMARYQAGLLREQGGELRKGIPVTLDIGRYQARAARQSGNIGMIRSILGGAAQGASIYGNLRNPPGR